MTKVYSNLKAFAFPDRLEALRERRLAAPVNIRIKPINRCNHDCWYCAYRVDSLPLGQDMDEEDVLPEAKMFEIIEDLAEMGVRAVTFSGGGEPLLYKPMPETIRRLGQAGIRVGCLTNGSNLKGRAADALAEHGTWVRVSVDAWDGPSYARARGIGEDAFGKLLENMRAFADRGSACVLGVSFILSRENHEHVREACLRFKEAGVRHVKLSSVVVSSSAVGNNEYHRAFRARMDSEIAAAMALSDDGFGIVDHYHESDERFCHNYSFCPTIQFIPVIGADGIVYTCQDKAFTREGALGSIRDRRFKDFWFSEENRQRVFSIDPRRDCPHHCANQEKNVTIADFLATHPDHMQFV